MDMDEQPIMHHGALPGWWGLEFEEENHPVLLGERWSDSRLRVTKMVGVSSNTDSWSRQTVLK